jgi:trehalose synthase
MHHVTIHPRTLDAYRAVIPEETLASLRALGRDLNGVRVIHINATPNGGGVAEILTSLVGLMRGLGLDAQWYVLAPEPAFAQITKKLHHALQGGAAALSLLETAWYRAYTAREAARLAATERAADLWIMHDPQSLPLRGFLPGQAPAVWVCHVDSSQPHPAVLPCVLPYLRDYQRGRV